MTPGSERNESGLEVWRLASWKPDHPSSPRQFILMAVDGTATVVDGRRKDVARNSVSDVY